MLLLAGRMIGAVLALLTADSLFSLYHLSRLARYTWGGGIKLHLIIKSKKSLGSGISNKITSDDPIWWIISF